MSNIKLRTSAGGSVTLTPENVAGDVTLTVPGDNSTLVSAADLSASTGAGGVGYLPAGTGAVTTTVQSKLRETVSVFDFMTAAQIAAVKAGTSTDDTAAFTALQAAYTDRVVDLGGWSYAVASIPTGNFYKNGRFVTSSGTINSASTQAVLSDASDTGGVEPAYTSGVNNTPTTSGRTTSHTRALIASQNSRATFARSVNVGSIYSWAYGNVSGNYSARQCVAGAPQAVNFGSEECVVYGFRGANIAAHYSGVWGGGSGVNLTSRYSGVSGRHAANIASVSAVAGTGSGALLSVTSSAGAVTAVQVVSGYAGSGYDPAKGAIVFYDRLSGGSGATATFTVDGSGAVTGVTVTNGGSGYSSSVSAVIDTLGDYSANIATTNGCATRYEATANLAANASIAAALRSANVATDACTTSGENAANVGSTNSVASGSRSFNLGSSGSTASGAGAMTISGNISEAAADGTVVIGRRTRSEITRAFVIGDSAAGSASTANRKFQVTAAGNVTASGTITGSTTFTDYAEYFENLQSGVIPLGTLVALDGRKVRPAQQGDDILGVVSGTAMVVAGDSPFTWSKRYLTGEFGELLMQDVECVDWATDESTFSGTVAEAQRLGLTPPETAKFYAERQPVENPAYDPERTNIPRSQRPDEWTCVGLLGQVHVRVTADVQSGDHVAAGDGGVGIKSDTATNMRCMEIRQPFDEAKGYAVAFCLVR